MKKFIIVLYAPINWDKVGKKVEYEPDGYVGTNKDCDFIRVIHKEDALHFQSFSEAVLAKNIYLALRNHKEFSIEEVEE